MQGSYEKFRIHDEVRFFSRSLTQEYANDTQQIRQQLMLNYADEQQMDYTSEELAILVVFNNYLNDGQYHEAEVFICEQLKELPQSILLNFNYAKYLKEHKRDYSTAINILEDILKRSYHHPNMLRLIPDTVSTTHRKSR